MTRGIGAQFTRGLLVCPAPPNCMHLGYTCMSLQPTCMHGHSMCVCACNRVLRACRFNPCMHARMRNSGMPHAALVSHVHAPLAHVHACMRNRAPRWWTAWREPTNPPALADKVSASAVLNARSVYVSVMARWPSLMTSWFTGSCA
jgi:hypothetical protein